MTFQPVGDGLFCQLTLGNLHDHINLVLKGGVEIVVIQSQREPHGLEPNSLVAIGKRVVGNDRVS